MKSMGQLILLLSLLASCSPLSKQQYLQQYNEFVGEVSEKAKRFTETDWQQANEKFARFNGELYNRFKHELTFDEKLQVASYRVQFNAAKAGVEMNRLYQSYLKDDMDSIKKNLQYYIENQMEDDISRVLDEAKRISDELYREVKKLIADLKKELK